VCKGRKWVKLSFYVFLVVGAFSTPTTPDGMMKWVGTIIRKAATLA
jgi:hypothetical protein